MNKSKTLLAGAALAGLLSGTGATLHAAQQAPNITRMAQPGILADDTDKGKHACKGQNACKGQGGCKAGGDNGCKGKNTCKGKGGCATDGSKA